MFVTDRLVFLQLEKTGCTHIKKLLTHLCGGTQFEKHSRITEDFRNGDRFILGSVRDPWDWYISMWSYGCLGKGSLHANLTSPARIRGHGFRKDAPLALRRLINEPMRMRRKWADTYADAKDARLFRRWLALLSEPENRWDTQDQFSESPVSRYAGYYSYRYAHLFTRDLDALYSSAMETAENFRALIQDGSMLDFVIRNERLEDDLLDVFRQCGIQLSNPQIEFVRSLEKTNASVRERKHHYYYDRETTKLVLARDEFIIEKYGYKPPATRHR